MWFNLIQPGFAGFSISDLYQAGGRLGAVVNSILPYRKSVVRENLDRYGTYFNVPSGKLNEISDYNYRHMGRLFLENFWFRSQSVNTIASLIEIDNLESDAWKILRSGKPSVVVLGHLGNWEPLIISYPYLTGHPIHFITKIIKSKSVNKYIHQMREMGGSRLIPTNSARDVLYQVLGQGGIVGLAADQSAPVDSHWQNFLGVPVPVFLGPATFSLRFKLPLIFAAPIRMPDGHFKVFFEEIPTEDLYGRQGQEPRFTLTARYFLVLEKYIRLFPEQYYWIHKRWKHAHKASDYLNKFQSGVSSP